MPIIFPISRYSVLGSPLRPGYHALPSCKTAANSNCERDQKWMHYYAAGRMLFYLQYSDGWLL